MKAATRLIKVLLPAPLEPTSAVVVPTGASNEMWRRTGTPGVYANETSSNRMWPSRRSTGRTPSRSSSRSTARISRIRSRPANASVICVPIDAI